MLCLGIAFSQELLETAMSGVVQACDPGAGHLHKPGPSAPVQSPPTPFWGDEMWFVMGLCLLAVFSGTRRRLGIGSCLSSTWKFLFIKFTCISSQWSQGALGLDGDLHSPCVGRGRDGAQWSPPHSISVSTTVLTAHSSGGAEERGCLPAPFPKQAEAHFHHVDC